MLRCASADRSVTQAVLPIGWQNLSLFCSVMRKKYPCLGSSAKLADKLGDALEWRRALENNVSSDSLLVYKHLINPSSSDLWEKTKEAFHLHESTLLLWEPKHASRVLLNSQQMLALVIWDADYRCQRSLAVFIEGPDLGTGSAALSVPSCTLCGHHIANGSGLYARIISLDPLNAFTAKPRAGQNSFSLYYSI